MSKCCALYLSAVFLTAWAPSVAQVSAPPSITEVYDGLYIAKLDILPEHLPLDTSFDERAVAQKLQTQKGDPFSQLTFDEDLKTLSQEYDRVEPSLEEHNGQLYITIRVWLRPTIRSIAWEGNQQFKTKTLQKELGIKAGSVLDRQAFNAAFNKVKEYYIKKGYFESQLQYKMLLDPKTNEVDIFI
ncbi:MAG: hypothetical protein FJZ58_05045, partial [Chlamydiae bacterium]|nr:hypothetical protein [Chlamydiota bacterium]